MSIQFNRFNNTFFLDSKEMTYAFRIHSGGFLQHLYFGKRVAREDLSHTIHLINRGHSTNNPATGRVESLDNLAMECPTYGRSDFRESMFAFDIGGVRVGDLKYVSHKIYNEKPQLEGMPALRSGRTLKVTLKEELHRFNVELYYTVYEEESAIARRMVITNKNKKPLRIDRAYSFCLDMADGAFQTVTLHGAHLRERHIVRNDLKEGVYVANSKYGVSSAQTNPFMALVRKNTDENQGEAYGFNLLYSGNFAFKAEVGQNGCARVLGGIQDYDFSWTLQTGESFSTPEGILVYSSSGLGDMSRKFHDLYRKDLINRKFVKKPRPIVLNNWEATYFNFDEEKLCSLIERVKGTGIDTFVLDDGWFGQRNGENAGLGDWVINRKKLPNGFDKIIECAHNNGMKFGLWFEPEMVNDDSDLYRAHPDWIIHVEGLEPCRGRLQFVLDLTREEVREYILQSLISVLSENQIDYVKWDMNRAITENYSERLGERGKEFAHRYVLGLYEILEKLTARFPDLFIEGCASGGCRFDGAILYYCPQIWTSDNSDAYERTIIQYGTSLCYPLSAASCHVSVCPNHQNGRNTPFSARTAIAHLGATGYELDPTFLSDEELSQIKKDTAEYREMEELILEGDLYRLSDSQDGNLFAEEIVSKDKRKAVITVMKPLSVANDYPIRIYPKGLKEGGRYALKEKDGLVLYGSTLMNAGLLMEFPMADFETIVYHLEEVK